MLLTPRVWVTHNAGAAGRVDANSLESPQMIFMFVETHYSCAKGGQCPHR